jgi:ribulose-phosphate 3-epimerase
MSDRPFLFSASILGADWFNFGHAVNTAVDAGADMIQIDIADGHFTPTITFGEELVRRIRAATALPIEAHLMVSNPNSWVAALGSLGVDFIIFHWEAVHRVQATINAVKNAGTGVGIALNSETRVDQLEHVLPYLDVITLMAILPGFARQRFIPETLVKVERLRKMIDELPRDSRPIIEIDGGIKPNTIQPVIQAGADAVVTSSAIYEADNPRTSLNDLASLAGAGRPEAAAALSTFLARVKERRDARKSDIESRPISGQ